MGGSERVEGDVTGEGDVRMGSHRYHTQGTKTKAQVKEASVGERNWMGRADDVESCARRL